MDVSSFKHEHRSADGRCRKERNELPLGEKLVPILYNLMRTADEVHVVFLKESGDDVWTEGERDASVVLRPPCNVFVWIGP